MLRVAANERKNNYRQNKTVYVRDAYGKRGKNNIKKEYRIGKNTKDAKLNKMIKSIYFWGRWKEGGG